MSGRRPLVSFSAEKWYSTYSCRGERTSMLILVFLRFFVSELWAVRGRQADRRNTAYMTHNDVINRVRVGLRWVCKMLIDHSVRRSGVDNWTDGCVQFVHLAQYRNALIAIQQKANCKSALVHTPAPIFMLYVCLLLDDKRLSRSTQATPTLHDVTSGSAAGKTTMMLSTDAKPRPTTLNAVQGSGKNNATPIHVKHVINLWNQSILYLIIWMIH